MTDPVEQIIADALDAVGIEYRRGFGGLDFHLTASDVWIECKRFHSPRIAVQSIEAARLLAEWIERGGDRQ
jgi:hypothetical protein